MLAFNFSFITASNPLLKRNLADDTKKFLLIGFGKYSNSEPDKRTFNMYIHLMNNPAEESYSNIYFNAYVIYEDKNKSDNVPVDCSYDSELEDQSLIYDCVIKNDNKNSIMNISLNNYQFKVTNSSGGNNLTFIKDQIILSTIANSTSKNIEKKNEPLNFNIFYLNEDPIIKKNEVELNGNIIWKDKGPNNFTFELSMPEKVNCSYYYNYTGKNYDKIIFSRQNDANIRLNAMMVKTSYSSAHYILIYKNNSDDLILYSKYEDSIVELLGFSEYTPPNTKSDAKNRAYFKGTINNLKRYMKFTAKIINSTNLRFLEESFNVTAYGVMDVDNIDLDNGLIIYNVTYIGTSKYKSIIGMNTFNDYTFSDDGETFTKSSAQMVYDNENINLTNTEEMIIDFITFNSSNRFESNSFSFDFSIPKAKQKFNINDKGVAYLNYKNMENSTRYEIGCSVENKSNLYTIFCKPDQDVYTQLKTIRIKIPQVQTTKRLRFLDEVGNSTFHAPQTQSGDIQFDYIPQLNKFSRKDSKNSGLSAGAIVAIILSSLAVIVAVSLAIYFLNKKPAKVGPKYIIDYKNQNSSVNINK